MHPSDGLMLFPSAVTAKQAGAYFSWWRVGSFGHIQPSFKHQRWTEGGGTEALRGAPVPRRMAEEFWVQPTIATK